MGEPEPVRHELQKKISSIVLTPVQDKNGPGYRVSGDVALFSDQPSQSVLQYNPGEPIALQYKIPIHFNIAVRSLRGQRSAKKRANIEAEISEREARDLDVEAILATALSECQTDGFSDIWEDVQLDTEGEDNYVYRDGFGGLRLAMAMSEPITDAPIHP